MGQVDPINAFQALEDVATSRENVATSLVVASPENVVASLGHVASPEKVLRPSEHVD
jgi:hypothetical protein